MDRVDELKAKARELERSDQPRSALEVYLRLARETDSQSTGSVWARIGDLQLQLGDAASAQESYSRAVELFGGAGQSNNAIAVALRRIRANGDDPIAHLTLGELSLGSGYRLYARDGLASYARHVARQGRAAEVIGAFTAFLDRYPDEIRLWKEWVAEMLDLGRKSEALDALRQLWEHLSERGATATANEVRESIIDIDPASDPSPPLKRPPAVRNAPQPDPQHQNPSDALPLLGYGLPSEPADTPAPIARIEGLEPTRADLEWDREGESTEPIASIPLIERSDIGSSSQGRAEEIGEHDDGAGHDDLPLLGVLPELDMDLPSLSRPIGPDHGPYKAEAASPKGDEDSRELPLIGLDTFGAEPAAGAPKSGIAAVVERIRSATGRRVEASDASTHYDLGLAYKEMGLADESLAHLAGALDGGHDPVAVIEVAGEILVERGDQAGARAVLLQATELGNPADRSFLGIHYWLARCEEALGDQTSARRYFEQVVKVDPEFRDTRSRLDSGGF